MGSERRTTSRGGRFLGGLIFAAGVVMLVAVFVLAAGAFAEIPAALAKAKGTSGPGLGSALATTGARAALLLVMAYVSSLLASKGLDLYQAARGDSAE